MDKPPVLAQSSALTVTSKIKHMCLWVKKDTFDPSLAMRRSYVIIDIKDSQMLCFLSLATYSARLFGTKTASPQLGGSFCNRKALYMSWQHLWRRSFSKMELRWAEWLKNSFAHVLKYECLFGERNQWGLEILSCALCRLKHTFTRSQQMHWFWFVCSYHLSGSFSKAFLSTAFLVFSMLCRSLVLWKL